MKRKMMGGFLAAMMAATLMAGCGKTEEPKETEVKEESQDGKEEKEDGWKIGVSVQSLSNQAWSAPCATMEAKAKEDGNSLTYMSCDENVATQIEQIENFITSDVDAIMVNAVDAEAIEEVCKEARDAGIKVMCWDDEMENSDLNWLVDNYDVGCIVGEEAAKFINEKFDNGECEVAVLDYPQTPILLERANGIVDTLKEKAPNAKIVAQQPAIDANEGLAAMENILQANPDLKVVCCIGGGGAVGANEALKAADMIQEDVGVFAVDATEQELSAIKGGEACRMSVMLTGTDTVRGEAAYGLIISMLDGTAEEKNVYRDAFPVTSENVDEYYGK